MNALFDLTGKRALVTGGTHGLGMAMAKGLARAGAELIINGTTPEKMENALKEYRAEGITVHGFLFDVTDDEAARKHVDKIEKEIGPIDILVNNAGIIKRIPLKEMDTEDYRKVIDVGFGWPLYYGQIRSKPYDWPGRRENYQYLFDDVGTWTRYRWSLCCSQRRFKNANPKYGHRMGPF